MSTVQCLSRGGRIVSLAGENWGFLRIGCVFRLVSSRDASEREIDNSRNYTVGSSYTGHTLRCGSPLAGSELLTSDTAWLIGHDVRRSLRTT